MKTIINKKTALIAAAFALTLTVGGIFFVKTNNLKSELSSEKSRAEVLLSQNLQLDKSLDLTKKDLADLKGKKHLMEKQIEDINKRITAKNAEIEKLRAQNASIKTLQKKIDELETLKKNRDYEISELNKTLAQANSEKLKLNEQISSANKTNNELSADNSILKAIISDNYRTEAVRGKNEKLTVNARRTNKLLVSFDLPANIAPTNVHFKVFTPEGNEFTSNKDLAATITYEENTDNLLASADQSSVAPSGTRRIQMEFKPKQKLTDGIYRFNLYNGDRFLGSTQLRLK